MQLRDEILATIVNYDAAWITPASISEKIQCPNDVVEDCLADLETESLITTWEDEDGRLSVTLTPLGAEKLGVQLTPIDDTRCRWMRLDQPAPRLHATSQVREAWEDSLPISDSSPGPEDIAAMNEEIGALCAFPISRRKQLPRTSWRGIQRLDENFLPYPTMLLGVGIALWDNIEHRVCPGCQNRELETYEYCLRCDRWGMDRQMQTRPVRTKVQAFAQRRVKDVNIRQRRANKTGQTQQHDARTKAASQT